MSLDLRVNYKDEVLDTRKDFLFFYYNNYDRNSLYVFFFLNNSSWNYWICTFDTLFYLVMEFLESVVK